MPSHGDSCDPSGMRTANRFRSRVWLCGLWVLLSAMGATACSDSDDDDGKPSGATCPSTSTLTYSNF